MKQLLSILFAVGITVTAALAQGVGINATGALPDPSAALDVDYNNRGFLAPRMTTAQRDAISAPATGLQIFNTDTDCIEFYSGGGSWINLCSQIQCAGFSATITASENISCNGANDGSAEVTALAGAVPYNYAWSGGGSTASVSGLSAGLQTVSVTDDNGCEVVAAVTITEPGVLSVSAGSNSPVEGGNNINLTATASGGTTPYSYSWSGPAAYSAGTQNPVRNVALLTYAGNYSVTVTDLYGCTATASTTVNVTFTCGSSVVADADSNTYNTVQIGSQCWMAENLNTQSTTGNSWCYDNSPGNCNLYGRLYDWAALMNGQSSSNSNPSGRQGLCPAGWHIPSDEEWCEMETTIGVPNANTTTGWRGTTEGTELKAISPTWNGTDDHGFTALPGGYWTGSSFNGINDYELFWTATEIPTNNAQAYMHYVITSQAGIYRHNTLGKNYGCAVRCVMD